MYQESDYIEISNFAKEFDYGPILNEVESHFDFLYDKEEMDDIGLKLQICVKKSKPMYLHGYVLSSALHKYLTDNDYKFINILETGTARGFSSIIMAKILEKFNVDGKINTIDFISTFDNCLKVAQLGRKITIEECVDEWKDLAEKYIKFNKGNSKNIIKQLDKEIDRINFAFLDGAHTYIDIKRELEFTERKQKMGDIIICDDYTSSQYPEICKGIDEFLLNNKYEYKIFYGNDGTKKRGYVYMRKKY